MEGHLLDIVGLSLTSHLSICSYAPFAAACLHCSQIADDVSERELANVFPRSVARSQLRRFLGPAVKARGCLLWNSRAAQRAHEIEIINGIGNRAKTMHKWIASARIDGGDVFAACKRAMLLSEDSQAVPEEVEQWLVYVVDAVECDSFDASIPAWQWLAEQGILDEGHTFWLLQLAHSLGTLRSALPLLESYPELANHTIAIADLLVKEPSMGIYCSDHCRLKARQVQCLLDKLKVGKTQKSMH